MHIAQFWKKALFLGKLLKQVFEENVTIAWFKCWLFTGLHQNCKFAAPMHVFTYEPAIADFHLISKKEVWVVRSKHEKVYDIQSDVSEIKS